MPYIIEGIEEEDIKYLYNDKDMSISDIALHYGVSYTCIWKRMVKHNIKRRTTSKAMRKYIINTDFFKTWTPGSSWVYGWLLGDGCFTEDRFFYISIIRDDKDVLYKIKEVIDSEHPVKDIEIYGGYNCISHQSRLTISSMEMVSDLQSLSIYDVPECYFNHFLRGFFEAEGCVYLHKLINRPHDTIGVTFSQDDEDMLTFISWCLKEFDVTSGGGLHLSSGVCQLTYGKHDTIALYYYMYDKCGSMFLNRKKEKYEELMDLYA